MRSLAMALVLAWSSGAWARDLREEEALPEARTLNEVRWSRRGNWLGAGLCTAALAGSTVAYFTAENPSVRLGAVPVGLAGLVGAPLYTLGALQDTAEMRQLDASLGR